MKNLLNAAKSATTSAYYDALFLKRTGLMSYQEVLIVSEAFMAVSRAQEALELALGRRGVAGRELSVDNTNVVAFKRPHRKWAAPPNQIQ